MSYFARFSARLRSRSRRRYRFPLALSILNLALTHITFAATTNSELADQIPPLRPPRDEIPPGFWEKHGIEAGIAAFLTLFLASLAIWLIRRKTAPTPLPPAMEARLALKPFIGQSEDGRSISVISQIVKRYFMAAFPLPQQQLTTSEFSHAAQASEPLGADLAERVRKFLVECDQRKFSTPNPPDSPWALATATALIDLGEQRKEYLRQQEKSAETVNARQS